VESYNVCNGGTQPTMAVSARVSPPGVTGAVAVSSEVNVCPGQPVLVSPVRASQRDVAP
jgi:hypothetical protein